MAHLLCKDIRTGVGGGWQALEAQASSDNPCEPCQPSGATGTDPPAVGSDMSSLYVDVLNSTLNIPMCYDKFTTNFKFPNGSYGSLTTGDYVSNGQNISLLNGNYSGGNIYSAAPQDRPNTSTLSVPPQYTGTGVGTAIPASELGSVIVYTTTIPGTTFTAPTTIPGTVRAATVNGVEVSTSIAPQTITQATTVSPQTTVVTTQVPDATAPASSKGAAGAVGVDASKSFGVSVLG
ncbi:hypothetical protein EJ07DRAFT_164242 [Lizonia empirigonia]|nr:hypothetical protein EJ07DRAFT_164242 [Lizonia empirigonia]